MAGAGHSYRPTEAKYKGGAQDMYVTYDLEQKTRSGYQRRSFSARRGAIRYHTRAAGVEPTAQRFTQIVDVPADAQHIEFHRRGVPASMLNFYINRAGPNLAPAQKRVLQRAKGELRALLGRS